MTWWIFYIGCLLSPPLWFWLGYVKATYNGYPKRHAKRQAWKEFRLSCIINAACIIVAAGIQLFW
jgi:hypothetical protein